MAIAAKYCGSSSSHLTLDHVVPKHRGGAYDWANLVSACPQCNRHKGSSTPMEAGMRLVHMPAEPTSYGPAIYTLSTWKGTRSGKGIWLAGRSIAGRAALLLLILEVA